MPSRAKAFALALPIPELAPVTSTDFPLSLCIVTNFQGTATAKIAVACEDDYLYFRAQ
jgi:hypothetical protein